MSDKPYISTSQITTFDGCGEQYRRKYIEREFLPSGVAGLRGSAVHGASEVNLRQKIASGVDLPLSDLVDAAATAFERRKDEGYMLTPEEKAIGASIVLGQAKDRAVKLTGLYADRVAPHIQPKKVETRQRIALPGEYDLLGILDVTTTDDRIKDLKTGKALAQETVDQSLQFSMYALTFRAVEGVDPTGIDVENLVDTRVPKHVRLTTTRGRRDYEVLVNRLNALLAAREAGVFAPAAIGEWRCSARWCSFFTTCRFANSERRAAADQVDVEQ